MSKMLFIESGPMLLPYPKPRQKECLKHLYGTIILQNKSQNNADRIKKCHCRSRQSVVRRSVTTGREGHIVIVTTTKRLEMN